MLSTVVASEEGSHLLRLDPSLIQLVEVAPDDLNLYPDLFCNQYALLWCISKRREQLLHE